MMHRLSLLPSRVLLLSICCMLWSASVSRYSYCKLQLMSLKLKSPPTSPRGPILAVILLRSTPKWATPIYCFRVVVPVPSMTKCTSWFGYPLWCSSLLRSAPTLCIILPPGNRIWGWGSRVYIMIFNDDGPISYASLPSLSLITSYSHYVCILYIFEWWQ